MKGLELIESYVKSPQTQAKASIVLSTLHTLKENDAEALAIAIMLLETVRNLPNVKGINDEAISKSN